jgi:SH3 domain protein
LNARLWIAAVVCACVAPCARAETLYVIELLYVSVNSAPDGSGERVGQIKSGDQVEVLERQDEQARIQLPSGEEGWVKASYLSADPPLREQVTARTQEVEKLRKEKAQLETDLASARTAAATAQASANAAIKAANNAARAPVAETKKPEVAAAVAATPPMQAAAEMGTPEPPARAAPPLFEDQPIMPTRPSWLLAVGSAVITLAAGFALGWWMLDRRIRAKYGGLRIY